MTKPIIFLMGPTASGKTALAIELVQQLPLEIISVDSALIYRDMDIGTAKPTKAELTIAPHHLINILDPTQHYSAGHFVKDVTALINDIHARGKLPLLVGGTMLYFKALQQGIANLPEQDPKIRAEIEEKAKQVGWPQLHSELTTLDPVAAAKIKRTDTQRIRRALEVFYLTGQPLSKLQEQPNSKEWVGLGDSQHVIPLALFPKDRSILHEQIAKRVYNMLDAGFIDEVIALKEKYLLTANLPSMRAVGYRQIWEFLAGEIPEKELADRIIFATRQYAKRQLTWLKSWPNVHTFDLDETLNIKRVLQQILS